MTRTRARRTWRRPVAGVAAGVVALLLVAAMAGCSSDKPKADPLVVATPPATVLIATTTIPGLGSVLSSGGRPLYVFSPDHHAVVTCTGACSGTWPPLRTAGQARAGAGVKAGDLGTVTSEGFDVVTFQGWPLYRYAGDTDSTQARGQALFLNGGPWYTIRADGEIVTTGSDRS